MKVKQKKFLTPEERLENDPTILYKDVFAPDYAGAGIKPNKIMYYRDDIEVKYVLKHSRQIILNEIQSKDILTPDDITNILYKVKIKCAVPAIKGLYPWLKRVYTTDRYTGANGWHFDNNTLVQFLIDHREELKAYNITDKLSFEVIPLKLDVNKKVVRPSYFYYTIIS